MKEGVKIRSGSQLLEIEIIESKKVNISDLNELLETGLAISILIILVVNLSVIRSDAGGMSPSNSTLSTIDICTSSV